MSRQLLPSGLSCFHCVLTYTDVNVNESLGSDLSHSDYPRTSFYPGVNLGWLRCPALTDNCL